ncbi:hypothetical protein PNOK_0825400 [Pyrrhoderma noxium]|uniref:C2H2-type domain-containing protein n=1 Tax=Pyrrhoderma noxium TaxID=2282107 RepID=A0A286UAT4_9AGAM|nr:hypothetical protein PNOK_0825400 [Pyrrhoderma noxium]
MENNIDTDMLNKLNRQGGNGPRNRSSVNPSLQEFYHTPGPNDLIFQPPFQHTQISEEDMRIKARVENYMNMNEIPIAIPSAAEQHEQQVMDKLNNRRQTQQSTPIVMSRGNGAPANSITSRTMHWGPESTTRTHVDQRRKSTSLPPVSIPSKAFGHPRDSHHPTQSTIQRMQRTTNNRPNQHATQMMNFNYGNRPTQQLPSVATPQVNRAHTSLIPQSAAHGGPRSGPRLETGIQAEGKRRLVQLASGSASLPSRAHGYSSHHPIQSTSQTVQRTTNDRPRMVHHRNGNSVFSQISPKTIEPRERVGAIAGPSTAPRPNVASTIDAPNSRTQVPPGPQAEVRKCERCAGTFKWQHKLDKHIRDRIELVCPEAKCSTMFCYKTDLEKHLSGAHQRSVFICGNCLTRNPNPAFPGFTAFPRRSLFEEHMKTCTQ